MDRSTLTPEEVHAVYALVRSPGWRIVMRELILPHMESITCMLDRPKNNFEQDNFYRGMKAAYKGLMEPLYRLGELPNPFEQYRKAFLVALDSYTDVEPSPTAENDPSSQDAAPKETPKPARERPHRVSRPV